MILFTPDDKANPLSSEFERLERTLSSFAQDIENLAQRVHSGDVVTETEVRKLFQDLRGWLKLAYEAERTVAEHNRKRKGISGDYGLDLAQAKSQIGCRLDRLRRCCDQGKVSK